MAHSGPDQAQNVSDVTDVATYFCQPRRPIEFLATFTRSARKIRDIAATGSGSQKNTAKIASAKYQITLTDFDRH